MIKLFLVLLIFAMPSMLYAQSCSELANSFSLNPANLSVNQLSRLRTCVIEEIRARNRISGPTYYPALPPATAIPNLQTAPVPSNPPLPPIHPTPSDPF